MQQTADEIRRDAFNSLVSRVELFTKMSPEKRLEIRDDMQRYFDGKEFRQHEICIKCKSKLKIHRNIRLIASDIYAPTMFVDNLAVCTNDSCGFVASQGSEANNGLGWKHNGEEVHFFKDISYSYVSQKIEPPEYEQIEDEAVLKITGFLMQSAQ